MQHAIAGVSTPLLAMLLGVTLSLGCGSGVRSESKPNYPAEFKRTSPPSGIEASAVARGSQVADVSAVSTGGAWSTRSERDQLVVFYRAYW